MSAIRIKTEELTNSFPCRAFYDSGEEALSVGIKQKGKFNFTIEAQFFSLDLTRDGKLLNIDVWKPRDEWIVKKGIAEPEVFDKQNVIIVDRGEPIATDAYFTNTKKDLLHIRFSDEPVARFISPANSLIFEVNKKNELLGLWITKIEEDVNFRKEAEWRRSVKEV